MPFFFIVFLCSTTSGDLFFDLFNREYKAHVMPSIKKIMSEADLQQNI